MKKVRTIEQNYYVCDVCGDEIYRTYNDRHTYHCCQLHEKYATLANSLEYEGQGDLAETLINRMRTRTRLASTDGSR